MIKDRVILHSDLNGFYASVEMVLNPALKGKAVAVGGSTEERRGIILARSELAKKAGVKTGMVNWEAKRICPKLIIVPPQYEEYLKYSKLTKEIYLRYTDQVEPYGMDECWLDVTGSQKLFGSGLEIAESIRKTVYKELGLTVSIGVSFNKIFAKLGSDLKKPNAITIIEKDNYQEKIWPLPARSLLFVGKATEKKLARYGIATIGDISRAGVDFMKRLLGKNGEKIWLYASGLDSSRVMPFDYQLPVKSIGQGITCTSDLENTGEAWKVMLELSQSIGERLRKHELSACGVQIAIRDNNLFYRQYQGQLPHLSQSPMEIALKAKALLQANYNWAFPIRAITVRAINLISAKAPEQLSIFDDLPKREKRKTIDDTIYNIRKRHGKDVIYQAVLHGDLKMPNSRVHEVIMPGVIYQ